MPDNRTTRCECTCTRVVFRHFGVNAKLLAELTNAAIANYDDAIVKPLHHHQKLYESSHQKRFNN